MNRPVPAPTVGQIVSRPGNAVARAVIACAQSALQGRDAEEVCRATWPDDRQALLVTRGAVSPAGTTWAAELSQTTSADLFSLLGPASAAGEILRKGILLSFGRSAAIHVPSLSAQANIVLFLKPADPLPIKSLLLDGPVLQQFKVGVGIALTREVLESSTLNAERLVKAALSESIALAVDAALFDASAAVEDLRTGGLRNGVVALPAATGTGTDAMVADLSALGAAVAGVGGSAIAFVASPEQATSIQIRVPTFPFPVFASSALEPGTIICVALPALVAAADPTPRIEVSREALIHSDTFPTAIGLPGSPPSIASSTRSLWQTDCLGIRVVWHVSWGLRASGSVAWIEDIGW